MITNQNHAGKWGGGGVYDGGGGGGDGCDGGGGQWTVDCRVFFS